MSVRADQSKTGIFDASISKRRVKIAGAGDSIIIGPGATGQCGSLYWQALRRGGKTPFYSVGNFAVSGMRTDQIAAQIAQAAAAGADMLVINGGTNDVLASFTEAQVRANLIANWDEARRRGMEPIDVGMLPTNNAGTVYRHANNEIWRKLYCAKHGIRSVDAWSVLSNEDGGFASGMNADSYHPSSVGAIAASAQLEQALQNNYYNAAPLLALTDLPDAGGFLSNAISFSPGYATTGTGGTVSTEPADANDLGSWRRCTVAAGTNAGFAVSGPTLASLGWAIGDRLAFGFRIRWSDTAQALSVSAKFTGVTISGDQPLTNETGGASGNAMYVYSEAVITAGTSVGVSWTATGTGYFEVNRPIVVNLTKLGLA